MLGLQYRETGCAVMGGVSVHIYRMLTDYFVPVNLARMALGKRSGEWKLVLTSHFIYIKRVSFDGSTDNFHAPLCFH